MEYTVVSKWCGWFGGWGSESDVAQIMNGLARQGWRLLRTDVAFCAWWLCLPRKKLLMVFQREQLAAS